MSRTLFMTLIGLFLISCELKNNHESNLDVNSELIKFDSEVIVIDLKNFKNLKKVRFLGNKELAFQEIEIDENKSVSYLYNMKYIYNKGLTLNTWLSFTKDGLLSPLDKCLTYEVTFEKEKENSYILSVHFPKHLMPEYPSRAYFGDFDREFKGEIIDTVPFNTYGEAKLRYLDLKKGKNEFFFILEVGEIVRKNGERKKILMYGKHEEFIE